MAGLYIFARDSQQYYAWEKPEVPATPLYAWKNDEGNVIYTKTVQPEDYQTVYDYAGNELDNSLSISVSSDYSYINYGKGSHTQYNRSASDDITLSGSPAKIYYTTSSTPNENDTVYVKIAGEMIETTKVNSYKPETPNLYAWHGEYKGSGERT